MAMKLAYPGLLYVILLLSAAAGWTVRRRLHERHVTRESVDSIRLMMGMLITFSALVLGLLTSNAKQRFDGYNNDLSAYGADLIELDHRLRVYGAETADIRRQLRIYTAAAIADSWPNEAPPPGDYPHYQHAPDVANVEGQSLGDMLANIDVAIEHLDPQDVFHRQIAERLRDRAALTIQQRWRLIFSTHSTISWPFLLVLTSWLSIIFAIFGLTSPRSRLIYAVVGLSALSIASPLYLIIDYSEPLSALSQLSSVPMRVALSHMDEPD